MAIFQYEGASLELLCKERQPDTVSTFYMPHGFELPCSNNAGGGLVVFKNHQFHGSLTNDFPQVECWESYASYQLIQCHYFRLWRTMSGTALLLAQTAKREKGVLTYKCQKSSSRATRVGPIACKVGVCVRPEPQGP